MAENLKRTIACKKCQASFNVDFGKAPTEVFTVACPKCGQKYQLKKPAAPPQSKVVQPPEQPRPSGSPDSATKKPANTSPGIDLSRFDPRSGWQYNLYSYTRAVPYAKNITLPIYSSKLVNSIASIVQQQVASGNITPAAYAMLKANMAATCSTIYATAIAPELADLGIPRFMQKPFAAQFTRSLSAQLSSSLVNMAAQEKASASPPGTIPNTDIHSISGTVIQAPDTAPPKALPEPTSPSSRLPVVHKPVSMAIWIIGGLMSIACFLPWIEWRGSWDLGVGGRGSLVMGDASGIHFWQGQIVLLLLVSAIGLKHARMGIAAGIIALLVPFAMVHFLLEMSGALDHSVGTSFMGHSLSYSSSAKPAIGSLSILVLSIPFPFLFLSASGRLIAFAIIALISGPILSHNDKLRTVGWTLTIIGIAILFAYVMAYVNGRPRAIAKGKPTEVKSPVQTGIHDPKIASIPTGLAIDQATAPATSPRKKIDPAVAALSRKRLKQIAVISCSTILLAGAIYGGIEFSKRHTLTAAERAQAEGWFAEVRDKENWVMLPLPGAEVPMFGLNIATPVVHANEYGMVTIDIAVTVQAHASELEYGRFNTSYQLNYTELTQPTELKLCRDGSEGSYLCLTWRIINPDSMNIRLDLGDGPDEFAVVPFDRYVQLKDKAERAEQMALLHALDSIGQGVGMVRKGAFMAYMCGDECGAMFMEQRGGQPQQVTYVCNTNRFDDIQLSQGDMLGKGDFTNRELQGHRFLIVSKAVAMPDGRQAWVVLGLLRDELFRSFPELDQRLALATNLDMLTSTSSSVSNTSAATQQYFNTGLVRDLNEVQEQPVFPGGIEALYAYLGKKVKYPSLESDAGIQGRVFIEFVVSSDGSITDVVLKRGVSGGLDEEAIRVVKGMPRWSPGRLDGQAVNVRYILPVNFVLR